MKHTYNPFNCNIQTNTEIKHLHVSTNTFLTKYICCQKWGQVMKNKLKRCEGKLAILKDLDTDKKHTKKLTSYYPPFRPGTKPKTKRIWNNSSNNWTTTLSSVLIYNYCELKLWMDSRHHLYQYHHLTVVNDRTFTENELDIMWKEMFMV